VAGSRRGRTALKILPIRSTSAFIVTATRHPPVFSLVRTDGLQSASAKEDLHIQLLSAIDEISKYVGSSKEANNGSEATLYKNFGYALYKHSVNLFNV